MVWECSLSPPLGPVFSVLRILQTLKKHRATLMEALIVLKMHIFFIARFLFSLEGKYPRKVERKAVHFTPVATLLLTLFQSDGL